MFDTPFYTSLIAIVAGFFTIIAGIIAGYISQKKIGQEEIQQKQMEELAKSLSLAAEGSRTRAIEEIAKRLPEEEQTPDKLSEAVTQGLRIGGDLVIHNEHGSQEIKLVQDLVTGYHQQALSQAKVQFWFSVIAATVGFIFIIYSASGINIENIASVINILPGAVIDAVALLFFRQAEQTRERATDLYDRLRSDNQMRSAIDIVEGIENISIKSTIKAQIALHMAGLQPKEIDITSINDEHENKD